MDVRSRCLPWVQAGGFLALLISSLNSVLAQDRPVIFEEAAQIRSPDPLYDLTNAIALDGNDLLACAVRRHEVDTVLYHFERQANAAWVLRGVILTGFADEPYICDVALEGGIGLFRSGRSRPHILERNATGWTITPPPSIDAQDVAGFAIHGRTIAIAGGRLGYSVVYLLEKNTAGTWAVTNTLQGARGFNDDDFLGPQIEFAGDELTAGNYSDDPFNNLSGNVTYVFDRIAGAWQRSGLLDDLFDSTILDGNVALRMDEWVVPGDIASFFTRDGVGRWVIRHSMLTDEWFADKRAAHIVVQVERQNALAFAAAPLDDARGQDGGSITVLTRADDSGTNQLGPFIHAATVVASDAAPLDNLGEAITASGRRVAALNAPGDIVASRFDRTIYIFELPDPIPGGNRVSDTFEDMNAAGWTPWGNTNWRVVASGGSQVFRQTNTQGDARAVFEGFEGTDQSIQVDLKVNSFADLSRSWAGLMLRYTDPLNFYYVLNQNSTKTLQIRKIVNGVFGPIATAPFTFQVGRTYRFRFEAIGTRLRAYVDDKLLVEVRDTTHPRGRAGLTMWKANTEYDNVVISSSPRTSLHVDTFSNTEDERSTPPWVVSPANAWARATTSSGATVFRQSIADGDARAVHGAPTVDQVIAADLRPLAFHPTPGSGFVGLLARYVNDQNYYYALLGRGGNVSLRRLINGQITVIDQVPFTVTPGTSYRMRFEAIGSALRVYVNGRLIVEGEDSTIESGRFGLVTYRGSAEYDNFNASRP